MQVAGTNYHWQDGLDCHLDADDDDETLDVAQAVSTVANWSPVSTRVARGRALTPRVVSVREDDVAPVTLQRQAGGTWRTVRSLRSAAGAVRVTFPVERRRGTFRYRLVVPGTDFTTGATTRPLAVRVR